jgi:cyclophilin family peptidyl-prolyl cis-trans isomerase
MRLCCLLILALCVANLDVVYAAPEAAKAKSKSATEEKAADDPNAQFVKLFGEWKQTLGKLYQLRNRFQKDPSADKKALEAEYNELMKQALAMTEPLSDAAEKAYLAAPNTNKELDDFMIKTLTGLVVGDEYEKATVWAQMLLDNKLEHKDLNLLAGMAYFAVNDFDKAGQYLQAAKDAGNITPSGDRYLKQVDKYKELWQKEKAIRAREDAANDLPKVKLQTSKGDIVIALLENEAPIATANFLDLVEKKFYDGLTFHRVLPGFMAQGGDPSGDGSGGPGYTIPDECRQENRRTHFRGSLSMAKTPEPDTGGSQFFLTFVPTSHLDGKHTVFGRVIEGMEVVPKLQRIEPGAPGTPDKIEKATVLSKRPHKYEILGKRLDKDKK